MATKKLTLSAPEDVIEKAKQTAARNGTSVSAMFARMLTAAAQTGQDQTPLGPITLEATGLVSLSDDKSDVQLLEEALEQRYVRHS